MESMLERVLYLSYSTYLSYRWNEWVGKVFNILGLKGTRFGENSILVSLRSLVGT